MTMARSKVTAQGQISVPLEVRRRLGVGPGSVLEWHEEGRKIVVRRSGRYNWQDVHRAVFPDGPPKPRTLVELKQAIRQYIVERHARR
jgi:AbrB family looped-hinge helix DNA binding protein